LGDNLIVDKSYEFALEVIGMNVRSSRFNVQGSRFYVLSLRECQTSFEADCFVVHESGLLAMTRGGCCKQGSGFKVRGFTF